MNARIPLRIVAQNQHSMIVAPWDFNMRIEYEYDAGEAPALYGNNPCPGTPPSVELLACYVGPIDILAALGSPQRERIRSLLLEQHE